MSLPAVKSPYAGCRFPAEVISQAVWLYFRFPLSLRMAEEMLAAGGIVVSHETIRQCALRFGPEFANRIWWSPPRVGDEWRLDEVAIEFAGAEHWLWRAANQAGMVLDGLVQGRRDKRRRSACYADCRSGSAGRPASWSPTSSRATRRPSGR